MLFLILLLLTLIITIFFIVRNVTQKNILILFCKTVFT